MSQDDLEREYEQDANEPPRTLEKLIGLTVMAATAVYAIAAFVLRLVY